MRKRTIVCGIILISIVVAGGLAILQSQSYEGELSRKALSYDMEVREEAGLDAGFIQRAAEGISAPAPEVPAAFESFEQQVIKTSFIALEVETFSAAADAIDGIAERYGGYVSNTSVQDYDGRKIGRITVRIPGNQFEEAVAEMKTVGDLQEENISLEDVTEQYIDLEARLENYKRQEQRYLEILEIAETVEDVLMVETQLERIRGSIESLQGTLDYMDNQIAFSTVDVRLLEPEEIVHESKLGEAFSRAVDGFLVTIRGIIIFLGYFIPIVIFVGLLVGLGLLIHRKLIKRYT
jgi:hypothetical protein